MNLVTRSSLDSDKPDGRGSVELAKINFCAHVETAHSLVGVFFVCVSLQIASPRIESVDWYQEQENK